MANKIMLLLSVTLCLVYAAEVELITEPKPGQEYVFLQTSAAGSRPIERKEKPSENERAFETAHKFPPSLTYALNKAEEDEEEIKPSKPQKREAVPAPAHPVPVPAGAIKLDPLKLIEKYKTVLATSTTEATKTTSKSSINKYRTTKSAPRRTKKEASNDDFVTNPTPVLTTGVSAVKPIDDDDIPYVAAGSEKQRSRIQIKKGPNGQEYEYEYVYYYYDDEDEKKDDKKSTNAHDGPARNEVTQKPTRSRGTTTTTSAPEAASNEIIPTNRARSRGSASGRQLNEDDSVAEERLPANTRFPPRSRNLNTTPASKDEDVVLEEETKPLTRGRTRGRPSNAVSAEDDSESQETQGNRGRTRTNLRRLSLDLVDNQSFNTHTNGGNGGEPPSNANGPTFPADLPAGPVRFLGATPNERMEIPLETAKSVPTQSATEEKEIPTETVTVEETTTMMSPMDKVALDLYAILQGTQRLSGEDEEGSTDVTTDATDLETTTLEMTTEIPTTEPPTTPTTTTTTTTTPAPTTTAVPEAPFGRGRYRGRTATPRRTTTQASGSSEAPQETKFSKAKFGRPSFGARPRPGARTTAAPTEVSEDVVAKEEEKPVSHARPTIGRSRFGAARTRTTTAAPSDSSNPDDTSASNSVTPTRASLRPRPTFNLRGRARTTAAPADGESSPAEESEASSTTARTRGRVVNPSANVRPLRPGPRINNLGGGRGRLNGAVSTEAPAEVAPVAEEEGSHAVEENADKETSEAPAADANPISRLRNRQRPNLQVRPKVAASAPAPVRRVNPLLSRRKLGGETSTSEAPQEVSSTETLPAAVVENEESETDTPAVSSTTEEPRGLNKLLAGRRRLIAHRNPGSNA